MLERAVSADRPSQPTTPRGGDSHAQRTQGIRSQWRYLRGALVRRSPLDRAPVSAAPEAAGHPAVSGKRPPRRRKLATCIHCGRDIEYDDATDAWHDDGASCDIVYCASQDDPDDYIDLGVASYQRHEASED